MKKRKTQGSVSGTGQPSLPSQPKTKTSGTCDNSLALKMNVLTAPTSGLPVLPTVLVMHALELGYYSEGALKLVRTASRLTDANEHYW